MDVTLYKHSGDGIALEQVNADFADQTLLEQPDILYRIDDRGLRFYYTLDPSYNPTFYGSTTTIKSLVTPTPRAIIEKELEMGKQAFRAYRDNRASMGTFWHLQAALFSEHGEYNLDELPERIKDWEESQQVDTRDWYPDCWKGLLSWFQFMQDYEVIPLAIEIPLAHPEGYAGTIDLVCQMNAKKYTEKTAAENRTRMNAIIDWKTGYIFPDHAIQLHLNKRIWEHHFPGQRVEKVFNWTWTNWRSRPGYELRDQTGSEEAALIDDYLHIWKVKHFSSPRDIRISGGTLQLQGKHGANSFWKKIPVAEYVKEKHKKIDGVIA